MSVLSTFSLVDRVAVVTGGNRSIGKAVAHGLAGAGASVAVVGRDRSRSRAAVEEIVAGGGRAAAVDCDVTDRGCNTATRPHTTGTDPFKRHIEDFADVVRAEGREDASPQHGVRAVQLVEAAGESVPHDGSKVTL